RDGHVTGVQTCALPISSQLLRFVLAPREDWQGSSLHLNSGDRCSTRFRIPIPLPQSADVLREIRPTRNARDRCVWWSREFASKVFRCCARTKFGPNCTLRKEL